VGWLVANALQGAILICNALYLNPCQRPRNCVKAQIMSSFGQVGGCMQPLPPSTGYPTKLPTSFQICKQEVLPLVNTRGPRVHLPPLFAIDRLKCAVQHPAYNLPPGMQLEHPLSVPLNKAVHRFESFMSATWPSDVVVPSTEATMPPLNVLMVRHTYPLV